MGDTGAPSSWEQTLDQDLEKLGRAVLTPTEAVGAHSPLTAPREPSTADGAVRSISVRQFRMEIFQSVRDGMTLSEDICDDSGVLLLAAESRITERFLQLLHDRGITQLRLGTPQRTPATPVPTVGPDSDDAELLSTALSRTLDERLAGELLEPIVYRPVLPWRRPRLSINDLKSQATQGVQKHVATGAAVADLCETVRVGERTTPEAVRQSIANFVAMAAIDFDLLPLVVAMKRPRNEYLFDHCVNVSLLSMSMAAHLGVDRERIMEIGLGGLLQDIGMLRVPESIRLATRPLTDSERLEIHRHPLHTLDMLANLRGIPQIVKLLAYQVHERLDGKGYPRGRFGAQIHEYAKIVAIADTYAALTHNRPHRPALTPYQAAKKVLKDGASDKFDRRLVRAFLDTVSLFPIGSQVGLSDGSSARVLRANPGLHTRPVVEQLSPDGSPTGIIIDLSSEEAGTVITSA